MWGWGIDKKGKQTGWEKKKKKKGMGRDRQGWTTE